MTENLNVLNAAVSLLVKAALLAENVDILNTAVSLLVRATLLAARFSGRVRKRTLKRLAATNIDAKAKESLFLKDKVPHVILFQRALTPDLAATRRSDRRLTGTPGPCVPLIG